MEIDPKAPEDATIATEGETEVNTSIVHTSFGFLSYFIYLRHTNSSAHLFVCF